MSDKTDFCFSKDILSVQFGTWTLSPAEQTLSNPDTSLQLEPLIFNLLSYFILNKDNVISRQELVENVWQQNFVDDNAINRAISELRKALKSPLETNTIIKTHYKAGYSFLPEPTFERVKSHDESKSIPTFSDVSRADNSFTVKNNLKYFFFVASLVLVIAVTIFIYNNSTATPDKANTKLKVVSEKIITATDGIYLVPLISHENENLLAYTYYPEPDGSESLKKRTLYIKNIATQQEHIIFSELGANAYPVRWFKDKYLYYQVFRENDINNPEIWRVDIEQGFKNLIHEKLFNVTSNRAIDADISSTGNELYYTKYNYRDYLMSSAIVKRNLNTGSEFQISSPNNEQRGDTFVALSNDETKLAFVRHQPNSSEIYISNTDGSQQRKVFETSQISSRLIWGKDDQAITWLGAESHTLDTFILNTKQHKTTPIESAYPLDKYISYQADMLTNKHYMIVTNAGNSDVHRVSIDNTGNSFDSFLNTDISEESVAPMHHSSGIFYIYGDAKKSLWYKKNGVRKKIHDLAYSQITNLDVSANDEKLLLSTNNNIHIFDTQNGNMLRTIPFSGRLRYSTWYSDDELLIVYYDKSYSYAWLYNIDSTELTQLTQSRTKKALAVDQNTIIAVTENYEVIRYQIDKNTTEILFLLPDDDLTIWTADQNYLYYAPVRSTNKIIKKSLSGDKPDQALPSPKKEIILDLKLDNRTNKPSLYIMSYALKNNQIVELKLQKNE